MNGEYSKQYFNDSSEKKSFTFEKYINFLKQEKVGISGKTILDIGCGTGNFFKELKEINQCHGCDISDYAISQCKQSFPEHEKNFFVSDLNTEAISDDLRFDLITMFDVIEHLYNFSNFRKLLQTNLAEGGYLVLTTPNIDSIFRTLLGNAKFTGEIDQTHLILFSPYSLDFFLRRCGLEKVSLSTPYIFYFKHDFITRTLLKGGQIFGIYKKTKKA